MLDNTKSIIQSSKRNGDLHGTKNTNSQNKFKALILKSSLCDYSDAFTLVKGDITVVGAGADDSARVGHSNNKQAIFKNLTA